MFAPTFNALVVDDDPTTRKMIAFALQREGFHCDLASDGLEALKHITVAEYDLVVTDLRMPNKHGHALAIEILGHKSPPLLIVHSVVNDPRLIADLLNRGVDDIIPKPTDYGVFAIKMKVLVEQRRSARQEKLSPATAEGLEIPVSRSATPPAYAVSLAAPAKSPPAALATVPARLPVDAQEASKSLSAMSCLITRSKVFERVDQCGELKPMSPILARLIQMLNAQECSAKDITRKIKQDHALCLKVLRLANSSAYSRGEYIESVEKAVLRIGMKNIRQAITNIGIIEQFSAKTSVAGLDIRQFWEHAMAVGLIAAELTRYAGGEDADADLAFTCGLLHDIGRAILAEQLGDIYPSVLAEAKKLNLPLEQVESRLLQTNHASVAERVLSRWRFPTQYISSIQQHHQPWSAIQKLPAKPAREAAILVLANRLAHALMLGKSGNDVIAPTAELAQMLALPADVFSLLEESISSKLDDLKLAMLSVSTSAPWPLASDELRKMITIPVRPLFVSMNRAHDAFGFLMSFVAGKNQGEGSLSNISVVHIENPAQISALAMMLSTMEAESNVGPLPLLVLSPGAELNLDADTIGSRRILQLPSVTMITTLIDAMMQLAATK